MRKFSQRENLLLILTVFVAVMYGGLRWVYRPLTAQMKQLDQQILLKEQTLLKEKHILRREGAVQKAYRRYEQRMKQRFSDSQEMALILSEIEKIANAVGLRLTETKPQKVKKKDFFHQFTVSLSLEGEMPLISRFLYDLEAAPSSFQIDEITLTRRSIRTSLIRCELVVSRFLIP